MTEGQITEAEKLLALGTQKVVYGPDNTNRIILGALSMSMGRDNLDLSCPKCLREELEFIKREVDMAKKKAAATAKTKQFKLKPRQFHLPGFGEVTPETLTDEVAIKALQHFGADGIRHFELYPADWESLI